MRATLATTAAVLALYLIVLADRASAQDAFTAGSHLCMAFSRTAGHYAGPKDVDPRHKAGQPIVGSCGYGELRRFTWPYFAGAAVSPESAVFKSDSQPANGCGRCLELHCTDKVHCKGAAPLQALVVDTCQSCAPTEIIVPYPVFVGNLTGKYTGEVPIRFRQVPCTPPGNVVVDVTMARPSAGGFLQLAIEQGGGNTPFPVNLLNKFGAVWQSPGPVPKAPLDVQIVDAPGAERTARAAIPKLAVGQYQTAIQFPVEAAVPLP